jgi:hypothetical protein
MFMISPKELIGTQGNLSHWSLELEKRAREKHTSISSRSSSEL